MANRLNGADTRDILNLCAARPTLARRLSAVGIMIGRPLFPSFSTEERREQSFQGFPTNCFVKPADLVIAGFFYVGCGDHVRCFCCGMGLRHWENGDDPYQEHARFFGHCNNLRACKGDAFIKQVQKKYALSTCSNVTAPTAKTSLSYQLFISLSMRQESFSTFPTSCPVKHVNLAEAGFFYSGCSDQVRCFTCPLILSGWLKDDDPWERHARWSPRCSYVVDIKGEAFSKQIREKYERELEEKALLGLRVRLEALWTRDQEAIEGTGDDEVGNVREENENEHEQEPISGVLEQGRGAEVNGDGDSIIEENTKQEPISGVLEQGRGAEVNGDGDSIIEENMKLKQMITCKMCLSNMVQIVCLPCGHVCSCLNCNNQIKKCPLCREDLLATVRIYL